MRPWAFLRDFPTARQTRLGLLIGLPLALIFGQRALAWADLTIKVWTAGQPLKAADLTAEFQKVKDEFTARQRFFAIKTGDKDIQLSTSPASFSPVADPLLIVSPKVSGKYKIQGYAWVVCANDTPGPSTYYFRLRVASASVPLSGDFFNFVAVNAAPSKNQAGNDGVGSSTLSPSIIADLKAGEIYSFGFEAKPDACKTFYIVGAGSQVQPPTLTAERID